jgi:hypothetical protein
MYNALMVYYHIDADRSKSIVQGLDVIHPYGTVGKLWDNGRLTFGVPIGSDLLVSLSQEIRTFTESFDEKEERRTSIRYFVEQADRMIFLGFAYHEQNLDRLFNNPEIMYALDGIPKRYTPEKVPGTVGDDRH